MELELFCRICVASGKRRSPSADEPTELLDTAGQELLADLRTLEVNFNVSFAFFISLNDKHQHNELHTQK